MIFHPLTVQIVLAHIVWLNTHVGPSSGHRLVWFSMACRTVTKCLKGLWPGMSTVSRRQPSVRGVDVELASY